MLDQRYIFFIPPDIRRIASLLVANNFHADDGVRQRVRVTPREHYRLVCLAAPEVPARIRELANIFRSWLTAGGRAS